MKPKLYPDSVIAEIRRKRKSGKSAARLAAEYHIHRKTVENYCKGAERLQYRENFLNKFMQCG